MSGKPLGGVGGRKDGWTESKSQRIEARGRETTAGARTAREQKAQSEQVRGRLAARVCVCFLDTTTPQCGNWRGAGWTVTLQGSPGESECHDLSRSWELIEQVCTAAAVASAEQPPTPVSVSPLCSLHPPPLYTTMSAGGKWEGYKINDGANRVFIIQLESNATPL